MRFQFGFIEMIIYSFRPFRPFAMICFISVKFHIWMIGIAYWRLWIASTRLNRLFEKQGIWDIIWIFVCKISLFEFVINMIQSELLELCLEVIELVWFFVFYDLNFRFFGKLLFVEALLFDFLQSGFLILSLGSSLHRH